MIAFRISSDLYGPSVLEMSGWAILILVIYFFARYFYYRKVIKQSDKAPISFFRFNSGIIKLNRFVRCNFSNMNPSFVKEQKEAARFLYKNGYDTDSLICLLTVLENKYSNIAFSKKIHPENYYWEDDCKKMIEIIKSVISE